MNRMFYTLPTPKEVGLKWKEYEKAREKVARIEERLEEAGRDRVRLEEEIKRLGDAEDAELKAAILRGEDDPAAKHGEHEKLVADLRDLRRRAEALSQALPAAEEELRLTAYEHQHRWKDEADGALEKAIEEERRAYEKAQALISGPRERRLYLEALAGWVRYPAPTFGVNTDVAVHSTMQNLVSGAYAAAERMRERAEVERVTAEQQEGAA